MIAGVALIVAFGRHALRVKRPLLDLRLYANRVFAGASLVTLMVGAALFGAMPIAFGHGAALEIDGLRPGARIDLAYRLEVNEYNGAEQVQLNCQHLQVR